MIMSALLVVNLILNTHTLSEGCVSDKGEITLMKFNKVVRCLSQMKLSQMLTYTATAYVLSTTVKQL